MLKSFYRRRLPHLQRDDKCHFVTFCTYQRWVLPEIARDVILACCRHDNGIRIHLHAAVVMPDHVYLLFVPLIHQELRQVWPLAEIMHAIKSSAAHKVNQLLKRRGKVWQAESCDHVVRSSESLDQKVEYLLDNPVRRGLVQKRWDYAWMWSRKEYATIGENFLTASK